MGSSVAACSQPAFAPRAALHPSGAGETSPLPSETPSASSDDESAFEASGAADLGTSAASPPELFRSLLPLQRARAQQYEAACQRAGEYDHEVEELRASLRRANAQEKDLEASTAQVLSELEAARTDEEYEADLRLVLLAELAERETRSSELHRQLADREASKKDLIADVANLHEDLVRLSKELSWLQRDREDDAGQRALLESEVCKAERSLANQMADRRTAHLGQILVASDLKGELRAAQAVEEHEAALADAAASALQDLEARRTALQLELMQEEHRRTSIEKHLNSMHEKLGMLRGQSGSRLEH